MANPGKISKQFKGYLFLFFGTFLIFTITNCFTRNAYAKQSDAIDATVCEREMFDKLEDRLTRLTFGASEWMKYFAKNQSVPATASMEAVCFSMLIENPRLVDQKYPDILVKKLEIANVPLVAIMEYSDRAGKRAALSHIFVYLGSEDYLYWIEPMDNSIFRTKNLTGYRQPIPLESSRFWGYLAPRLVNQMMEKETTLR